MIASKIYLHEIRKNRRETSQLSNRLSITNLSLTQNARRSLSKEEKKFHCFCRLQMRSPLRVLVYTFPYRLEYFYVLDRKTWLIDSWTRLLFYSNASIAAPSRRVHMSSMHQVRQFFVYPVIDNWSCCITILHFHFVTNIYKLTAKFQSSWNLFCCWHWFLSRIGKYYKTIVTVSPELFNKKIESNPFFYTLFEANEL